MTRLTTTVANSLSPPERRALRAISEGRIDPSQLAAPLLARLKDLGLVETYPKRGSLPRPPELSDIGRLVATRLG